MQSFNSRVFLSLATVITAWPAELPWGSGLVVVESYFELFETLREEGIVGIDQKNPEVRQILFFDLRTELLCRDEPNVARTMVD